MQLGSTEAVKQAVKAGLGVSLVLASAVTEEVGSGSLCAVPFSGAGLDKELMVVWRENPAKSDQLPGFISHLLNESATIQRQSPVNRGFVVSGCC